MLLASLEGDQDGRIGLLLRNDPDFIVDVETLDHAILKANLDDFSLLLGRTSETTLSMETAVKKKERVDPDKIPLLMGKSESFSVETVLLAFLQNPEKDDRTKYETARLILVRGGSPAIFTKILREAAKNTSAMLDLFLYHAGKVTQEMWDEVAACISPEGLVWCLDQGCQITGRTLKKCAKSRGWKPDCHANLYFLL